MIIWIQKSISGFGVDMASAPKFLFVVRRLDDMSQEKLDAYGIAPPNGKASEQQFEGKPRSCPQCGSTETELISRYGATPCKASYRCLTCLEPFEYFKCF